MALPRYKKCCMCTNVRTGAIILAMIGILGAGISVISLSVGLGYRAPMIEDRIEDEKIASMAKFQKERPTSEEDIAQYHANWQKLDLIKELVPWVFIVQIIWPVSNILVNGCKLFGVTKKKPGFILPWLIIHMTYFVLTVALLSLVFFVMCIFHIWKYAVILVLLTSPFLGLTMYFWLVVRSVYLDIHETKGTKPVALPRYKKCCMCTNVRTGAIILAMIGILAGGISVISHSVGLGYYAPMMEDRIEDEKIASMTKFQEERPTSEEDIAQYQAYWHKLDFIKELVPWVFTVLIISSVSNILVNGCMLFGVTKKKPGFILPWLIISMTCIVLTVALLSLVFFVMCIGTHAGILSKVILVLVTSLFVGLIMYFWLVVRSVYLDICETKVTKPVEVDHEAQIEKAGGKYMKM